MEFVAALPFIIVLASLMIVVGGAGLVKSRAQINARYALTRTVGPIRNPGGDPNPHNWDAPATLTAGGGTALTGSEAIWSVMPDDGIVRGGGTIPGSIRVDGLLEMGSSVHTGDARYRRRIVLLNKILPMRTFDARVSAETVDNEWQYYGLGIAGNRGRRADPWYAIDPGELGGTPAQQEAALKAAQNELKGAAFSNDLNPLDRDEELRAHYGSYRDFHPNMGGCTTFLLGSPSHDNFLERIDRVPISMADAWIAMYRDKMREVQERRDNRERDRIAAQRDLRNTAAAVVRARNNGDVQEAARLERQADALRTRIAELERGIAADEAEIADWQAKIDQMERFKQAYRSSSGVR